MFRRLFRTNLLIPLFFLFVINSPAKAQGMPPDTLKLTIKQAEDRFLKNNLQVIIQRFNIDNASAQIITAKLFPIPILAFLTVSTPMMLRRGRPTRTKHSMSRNYLLLQVSGIKI